MFVLPDYFISILLVLFNICQLVGRDPRESRGMNFSWWRALAKIPCSDSI